MASKNYDPTNIINGRYKITKRIGSGGFGAVFKCKDKQTGKDMAVKIEDIDPERDQSLIHEVNLFINLQGATGFPRLRWYGREKLFFDEYRYGRPAYIIIMDMLGPSLEDVFDYCGRKFSVKTVLMLAEQLLTRIECLHNKGYIHRDLKPDNLVMGTGRNINTVHIVDFGLCRPYLGQGDKHLSMKEGRGFTGTARYGSLNAHEGNTLSRRDDLESLSYTLLYLLRGSLPWQDYKTQDKQKKYQYIYDKKTSISPEKLGKGFPEEFVTFLKYSRGLEYKQKPDYQYLRQLFRNLFYARNYQYDNIYDWNVKPNPESKGTVSSKSGMEVKQKPAENHQKSAEVVENNPDPAEKAQNSQKPGENSQRPGGNSQKSGENSQRPGGKSKKSGENCPKLAENSQRPEKNLQKPEEDHQKLDERCQQPEANSPKPVGEVSNDVLLIKKIVETSPQEQIVPQVQHTPTCIIPEDSVLCSPCPVLETVVAVSQNTNTYPQDVGNVENLSRELIQSEPTNLMVVSPIKDSNQHDEVNVVHKTNVQVVPMDEQKTLSPIKSSIPEPIEHNVEENMEVS